jgi:hypothetical protein
MCNMIKFIFSIGLLVILFSCDSNYTIEVEKPKIDPRYAQFWNGGYQAEGTLLVSSIKDGSGFITFPVIILPYPFTCDVNNFYQAENINDPGKTVWKYKLTVTIDGKNTAYILYQTNR